jgi:hypothetical protein
LLDASLPRAGASRLDLLAAIDPAAAEGLRSMLAAGEPQPAMTYEALAADGLDRSARAVVLATTRPRGLDFFEEVLPHPGDWPDAPVGYLQTSPGRADTAKVAGHRGFTVAVTTGGHFAWLANADRTADALVDLVTAL